MTELSKNAKLTMKYTNHCVHVTGMTNLTRANFSANQIMSVTGHKSVNSLVMYQRVKADKKMMMGMSLAYNLFSPQEVFDKTRESCNSSSGHTRSTTTTCDITKTRNQSTNS